MQHIRGEACPSTPQRCLEWISRSPARCARFAPDSSCPGAREPHDFCIDRYEYPNQAGALPQVMVSFIEARASCEALGKRLCTSREWTFACEGEAGLPYPYGLERDAEACNIDRPHRAPDFQQFAHGDAAAEAARLDQRVPSGSRARCLSPFGVGDMTGNVDEWVVNESGEPFVSGLKGGYWGKIRARCRPMTTAHGPEFRFYQIGFRCCAAPAPAR